MPLLYTHIRFIYFIPLLYLYLILYLYPYYTILIHTHTLDLLILFYVYKCWPAVCACSVPREVRSEEGVGSPELESWIVVNHPQVLGIKPLQKQQVLLNIEPLLIIWIFLKIRVNSYFSEKHSDSSINSKDQNSKTENSQKKLTEISTQSGGEKP